MRWCGQSPAPLAEKFEVLVTFVTRRQLSIERTYTRLRLGQTNAKEPNSPRIRSILDSSAGCYRSRFGCSKHFLGKALELRHNIFWFLAG